MARSLNIDEAEVFKNAISPERKFTLEYGSFEGLVEGREDDLESTMESAFWFGGHITGAANS